MLLILGTDAHSATVIWPAVGFARTVDGDATYAIGSDASPSGGAAIGLEIVDGPGNMSLLQAYSATAGIGHEWFAMQYGAAVDASALSGADFLLHGDTIMEYGSIYMPLNQIFYIGFSLDGTDPVPPDYTTPSYYI